MSHCSLNGKSDGTSCHSAQVFDKAKVKNDYQNLSGHCVNNCEFGLQTCNADTLSGIRILMCASLRRFCGNFATVNRIRDYFLSAGAETVLVEDPSIFKSNEDFNNFVHGHDIDLMIALHVYRGGRWLAENEISRLGKVVPYIIIYGGTDLSQFSSDPELLRTMTKIISKSNALVVFNDEMKQDALRIWELGLKSDCNTNVLDASSFTIIPQAPTLYSSQKDVLHEVLKEYKLNPDATIFSLVTGIRPVKDPTYLISEFQDWSSRRNYNVYLLVIGPVLNETCFNRFKLDIEKAPSVVYIGPRSPEDTQAIVKSSCALVNCSLSEGMSNAILEALGLGVPVLVRDIPGNTSMIKHRKSGLVFSTPQEFVSMAEELIQDCSLRSRLVQSGLDYVSANHNATREMQAYVSLAKQLTSAKK